MKWWIGPLTVFAIGCCAWGAFLKSSEVTWEEVVVSTPTVLQAPEPQPRDFAKQPTPARKRKPAKSNAVLSECINVNTANAARLSLLPGIGPAIAQRIIDSRERDGNYANPEDLVRVKGIGPARLEKIRGHICF